VNLLPGITRSTNDISKLTLAANTKTAQFSLALLDDNFPTYRTSLTNADGREVWSRDKISASVTADGKMIKLAVPAETLSDGDYSFVLSGIPASGASENVARYYFRVTHQ
jgi:hypothetical protein